MPTESTTYDRKFNAQRGAQRAGLQPGKFEVFKTPDGRFGWRAITGSEPAISMNDPTLAEHPIAQTNAASWPSGPKTGKRKAIIEQAQAGALPAAPDFSKPTHARFRAKLAKLVALAEAGDVEGLKAININPVSTSPKAMARYRDLAIIAIQARRTAA
ncbi:MAG: hypothetical protein IOC56_02675 [Methylobacterium sp.]|nr:hypothetical protein [Methylobacterium sp.]MCA3617585.1 hypothetical protein [Methylobacterium sp.]MCA3619978.1 hypothetical protein [Methylobacterium sp.]